MERRLLLLTALLTAVSARAEDPKPKPEPILTGWEATVIRAEDENADSPGERNRQEHFRRQAAEELTPGEIARRQLSGVTAAPEAAPRRAPRAPAADASGVGVQAPGDGFSSGPAGNASSFATPPASAKASSTATAGKKASGLMSKMAGAFKSMGDAAGDTVKGPAGASAGPSAAASRATVSDGLAPRAAGSTVSPATNAASPAAVRPSAGAVAAAKLRGLPPDAPLALVKRPDFHQILPPAGYIALKETYAVPGGAARAPFKDVGMTDDRRDFKWTRSCDKVSGDCNPQARGKDEGGYAKNEEVSPETLAAVLAAIDREMAADSATTPDRGARRVTAASPDFAAAAGEEPAMGKLVREDGSYAPSAEGPSAAVEPAREKGLLIFSLPAPGQGEPGRLPWRPLAWAFSLGGALALAWFFRRRRRGSTDAG